VSFNDVFNFRRSYTSRCRYLWSPGPLSLHQTRLSPNVDASLRANCYSLADQSQLRKQWTVSDCKQTALQVDGLISEPSVNRVVPTHQVLSTSIAWAKEITDNSPDAVASTKRGILMGKQFAGIETSTIAHAWSIESKRVYEGENIRVGIISDPAE
jgi:hypothetical protein